MTNYGDLVRKFLDHSSKHHIQGGGLRLFTEHSDNLLNLAKLYEVYNAYEYFYSSIWKGHLSCAIGGASA